MAQMTVRIDDNLKVQAEMLFAEIGMPLSTAVTIFLKQAVRSNGMPFPLKADPFFSAENPACLLKAKERMERQSGPHSDAGAHSSRKATKSPGIRRHPGLASTSASKRPPFEYQASFASNASASA